MNIKLTITDEDNGEQTITIPVLGETTELKSLCLLISNAVISTNEVSIEATEEDFIPDELVFSSVRTGATSAINYLAVYKPGITRSGQLPPEQLPKFVAACLLSLGLKQTTKITLRAVQFGNN